MTTYLYLSLPHINQQTKNKKGAALGVIAHSSSLHYRAPCKFLSAEIFQGAFLSFLRVKIKILLSKFMRLSVGMQWYFFSFIRGKNEN